jgi:hypothetical protein
VSHDSSKNDEADRFFRDIEADRPESLAERKGRHYVEGEARFATVAALAELAQTVTTLARAQAENVVSMDTLLKDFRVAAKDVAMMKIWMEGTVSDSGVREPGVIDHIATFRRWKNVVIALLSAIFSAQVANAIIGLLNHSATQALTNGAIK